MIKYELVEVQGSRLFRLKALRAFDNVKVGDLGGLIEKELNLSHDGNCWVCYNARVAGNARVSGDARVSGNAHIYGSAVVLDKSRIYGSAVISGYVEISGLVEVFGKATVMGRAVLSDKARIYGDSIITGNANICDNVEVYGNALITDYTRISSNAHICGTVEANGNAKIACGMKINRSKDYMCIGPIGSRGSHLTCTKGIHYVTGCFAGSRDEFIESVKNRHGDNEYAKAYLATVDYFDIIFGIGK